MISFPRPGVSCPKPAASADSLLGDRRGLSTVEYVILLVLIASVAIGAWRLFGERVARMASSSSDRLGVLGEALEGASDWAGEGSSIPPPPSGAGAPGPTGPTPPAAPSLAKTALVQSLVQTRGGATAADAAAVMRELSKLPESTLRLLKSYGTKIVVVDQSVVQASPQLANAPPPRGWPAGSYWPTVPGVYDNSANNQVVVVVKNGVIPPSGQGHGSNNLVLHETGHAVQAALEKPYPSEGGQLRSPPTAGAKDPPFINARNQDLATLSPYQRQPGNAGVDETYAESMASYYDNPAAMQAAHPNLYNYWSTHPPGGK